MNAIFRSGAAVILLGHSPNKLTYYNIFYSIMRTKYDFLFGHLQLDLSCDIRQLLMSFMLTLILKIISLLEQTKAKFSQRIYANQNNETGTVASEPRYLPLF